MYGYQYSVKAYVLTGGILIDAILIDGLFLLYIIIMSFVKGIYFISKTIMFLCYVMIMHLDKIENWYIIVD